MAKHKVRGQRKLYVARFEKTHNMTRAEWRDLKKNDPQKAHEIRMRLQKTS